MPAEPVRGPFVYENWQAWFSRSAPVDAFEYLLFSDARITGGHLSFGPYQIFNTVAHAAAPFEHSVSPVMVLRYESHEEFRLPDMSKTNVSRYHGGDLIDEIAALVSLAMGIRLHAGGITRNIHAHGDPRGEPVAYCGFGQPILIKARRNLILPNAAGCHSMEDARPFLDEPIADPADGMTLVRAARLYQQALWVAESQPALAWLFLTSSVEAAAQRWDASAATPLERLRAAKPDLVAAAERRCPDFVEVLAAELAGLTGAIGKFLAFLFHFLPPPPVRRPPELHQFTWESPSLRRALKTIYDCRSQALHSGVPFPDPMCEAPIRLEPDWAAPVEKPAGFAAGAKGGVWLAKSTPMLLHVFEHLVRGTLLKWWESLAASKPASNCESGDTAPR